MSKLLFGSIESPCTYGWENMQGDERLRFCEQCKLHVLNLSEVTDVEAATLIENSGDGRLCVRMRTREDGSIYTDNCPYKLRRLRNAVRTAAPWLLLALAFVFGQTTADAQGLLGAPVGGRLGQSNVVDSVRDTSYAQAEAIVNWSAAGSFLSLLFACCWRIRAVRELDLRLYWQGARSRYCRRLIRRTTLFYLAALTVIPPLVYLVGMAAANSWVALNIFSGSARQEFYDR